MIDLMYNIYQCTALHYFYLFVSFFPLQNIYLTKGNTSYDMFTSVFQPVEQFGISQALKILTTMLKLLTEKYSSKHHQKACMHLANYSQKLTNGEFIKTW